jgi:putative addiction module component (TIGR02574 family)
MTIREQVLQEALALPPEDRAFLAERLDQSLDHEQFASAEIAAAWTAEINRRLGAYERGEVQAADADSSIARMRQYLADHRARKVTREA